MDSRKAFNDFQEYRKYLDEALYRDKSLKIDFYYELNKDFVSEDLDELKKSVDNMIKTLREINKSL